jgi:hypothetical protein
VPTLKVNGVTLITEQEKANSSDENEEKKPESSDEDETLNHGNNKLEAEVKLPSKIKEKLSNLEIDHARGEGNLLSADSSSDEESSDEEGILNIYHVWGELDNDAPRTDKSTSRIAACNMDWDRMRAVDIMVLCNSFLPKTGTMMSVTIYPSDFGKQRLAEEETRDPQELIEKDDQAEESEPEEETADPRNEEEEKEQSAAGARKQGF